MPAQIRKTVAMDRSRLLSVTFPPIRQNRKSSRQIPERHGKQYFGPIPPRIELPPQVGEMPAGVQLLQQVQHVLVALRSTGEFALHVRAQVKAGEIRLPFGREHQRQVANRGEIPWRLAPLE